LTSNLSLTKKKTAVIDSRVTQATSHFALAAQPVDSNHTCCDIFRRCIDRCCCFSALTKVVFIFSDCRFCL